MQIIFDFAQFLGLHVLNGSSRVLKGHFMFDFCQNWLFSASIPCQKDQESSIVGPPSLVFSTNDTADQRIRRAGGSLDRLLLVENTQQQRKLELLQDERLVGLETDGEWTRCSGALLSVRIPTTNGGVLWVG